MEKYQVTLIGDITRPLEFSHEKNQEQFFNGEIEVERTSGIIDYIPIIVSNKLLSQNYEWYRTSRVCVLGEIRTRDYVEGNTFHLGLSVFVLDIFAIDTNPKNHVELIGYLCKKPVIRTTPKGRVLADTTIAVNRKYAKSDYIPCVFWGRNAKYIASLSVGDMIQLDGRLQSRIYKKCIGGEYIEKTTYELSVSQVVLLMQTA